jgi:hypothetical protein
LDGTGTGMIGVSRPPGPSVAAAGLGTQVAPPEPGDELQAVSSAPAAPTIAIVREAVRRIRPVCLAHLWARQAVVRFVIVAHSRPQVGNTGAVQAVTFSNGNTDWVERPNDYAEREFA